VGGCGTKGDGEGGGKGGRQSGRGSAAAKSVMTSGRGSSRARKGVPAGCERGTVGHFVAIQEMVVQISRIYVKIENGLMTI